ncbi:hypothetical protein [uncultured Alsobacter sp.]|uniref:hypothetical protein n=1 Tax=uncultured Alsobacter sp. TaxID=1748258 RepID=UPI0025D48D57|nr:hypothetical protein [uncultured Alsobacter sp.]
MTTHRMLQSDLTAEALRCAHTFQLQTLAQMLQGGWVVKSVRRQGGVTVITVDHPHGGFGLIAPNGMFQRPLKGSKSVTWCWSKMADLAKATVPFCNAPKAA